MMRAAILLLPLLLALPPVAQAQPRLPEHVVEDPCADADAFDDDDDSREAAAARRRCRLERYRQREAAAAAQVPQGEIERERARQLQAWADRNLPYRATRPLSADAFLGLGIVSYGIALSYLVATPLEIGVWIGGAGTSYRNDYAASSIAYTRLVFALRARLLILPTNFTPFVGAGIGQTQAPLNAYVPDPNADPNSYWTPPVQVQGAGRAHFVTVEAGAQYCRKGWRFAAMYAFGYAFYTQANLLDENNTQDPALRLVWQQSLDDNQHGFRLEVGYAF